MAFFLGLLAHQEGQSLGQRPQSVHGLKLERASFAVSRATLRDRRVGRSEVQSGPGHPVAGRVDLKAEAGQDGESENAVNRRTGKTQRVHAHKLKRVFDPRLDPMQRGASFEIKPIDGSPELPLGRFQADLGGRLGGDVKGWSSRIDQEVERPLAINPHADQKMIRIRQSIRNLKRLPDLGIARTAARLGRLWVLAPVYRCQGKCQHQRLPRP